MNNEHLQHHGILGMKWGVRRKKGPGGTVGSRGKNSETKEEESSDSTVKNKGSAGSSTAKKSPKDMSDEELRRMVSRLQLESQYSKLATSDVSKGQKYVKRAMAVGTTVAAASTTAITIYNNAEKIKEIMRKVHAVS